jgi:hypothetical protein
MHLVADAADVEDDKILAIAVDQAFELADHDDDSEAGTSLSSCPVLYRASMSFFADVQDVDGRYKAGHDGSD